MNNGTKEKSGKPLHFGYQAKESIDSLLSPPSGGTGEIVPLVNLQTNNDNEKDKDKDKDKDKKVK
ncbi:hypothetical protein FRZ06_11425 [Anoxybacterium hadale]|uniref:Uncharacterized protein n=1 Tax=Anoxybacterium hadale TaxID=3408580 RepID=A0ACD1AC58_9FIRM|nr:hypothetical protein FRZ06_11425 [Clostridiales bacterium]